MNKIQLNVYCLFNIKQNIGTFKACESEMGILNVFKCFSLHARKNEGVILTKKRSTKCLEIFFPTIVFFLVLPIYLV